MRNIKLRVGTVQEWGKTGENNAAALVLDVTENLSLWPDGQPQAVYYRPDGTVYPLPCSLSGSTVEVPLTATETATAGRAQIEIQWIDEGVLAKSATHSGNIVQSLAEPGEEPPEPMQSWLDQLTGLAGDAAEAAEDAAVAQGLAEDARDEAQGYATGMTTAIEEALEPITEELALKADKATTYTKTEADAAAGVAIAAAIAPVTSQLDAKADFDATANWRTATGNPAAIYPVPKSHLYPRIELVATQEGEGDPSPENIRPIVPSLLTGQKVKATRTGKNLFDGIGVVNGFINTASTSNIISDVQSRVVFLPCLPNKQYTMSKLSGARFRIGMTDSIPAVGVSLRGIVYSDKASSLTITTDATAKYLVAFVWNEVYDTSTWNDMHSSIQIELGSVATPYEPYTGADYDLLTAEQDFYGLPDAPVVVDAEAGTVTVGDAIKVFDGTEAWNVVKYSPDGSDWYYTCAKITGAKDASTILRACSHYPNANVINTSTLQGFSVVWAQPRIRWGAEQSVADWKAYLAAQYAAGTPVVIQYQLATPITIPITPPVIAALERLKRTEARQNVLTVTANDSTVGVQKQTVTYQKSPIRESDEIAAAIAALA